MRTTWFATNDAYSGLGGMGHAEVDLGHFAAIRGMTRGQYARHMVAAISEGRVADLLSDGVAADLGLWIKRGDLLNGEQFCVMFRLSLNRTHDQAMFCLCRCHGGVEDVENDKIVMAHADMPPDEFRHLLRYEVMFCDMR